MKYLIAVDMEGVACAYAPYGSCVEGSFNVEFVRKQATREANAAAAALFDSGATEVTVWDAHGRGCNLDYDSLDERCLIAIGSTVGERYPNLDKNFSGVLFIGYHANASNGDAAIAHTFSITEYQFIKVNGVEFGEIAIDASIAGSIGVPVIFVSGDSECVAEAKKFLPFAETVETKKSYAYTRIVSKHPKAVAKEIYEGVKKAVSRLDEMKLFTVSSPFTAEFRFRRTDAAKHAKLIDIDGNRFEQTDGYTRTGKLNKIEDLIL